MRFAIAYRLASFGFSRPFGDWLGTRALLVARRLSETAWGLAYVDADLDLPF